MQRLICAPGIGEEQSGMLPSPLGQPNVFQTQHLLDLLFVAL